MYTIQDYDNYLKYKTIHIDPKGISVEKEDIKPICKDLQVALIKWGLWLGKAAIFKDTGLGKTFVQLEMARLVCERVGGNALLFAPLTVVNQTANIEAITLGYEPGQVNICESQDDVKPGINITNYEKLHKFDIDKFTMIGLDEASIMKSYKGFYRNELIEKCKNIKYRYVFTATPDPNDRTELGNYAEFLGVTKRKQMLADFFVNDQKDTQGWRLKTHSKAKFWKWISTWAAFITRPSDIGLSNDGYELPELKIINHVVESNKRNLPGYLFKQNAQTMMERKRARQQTISERVNKVKEIIEESPKGMHHLVFCGLNPEGIELDKAIPDAVEVAGRHSDDIKKERVNGFANGDHRILITKTDIAGLGMNFQKNCSSVIFCGLSDSWEAFKQGYSRVYRPLQKNTVTVHVVTADIEGNVLMNIERKGKNAIDKQAQIVQYTKGYLKENLEIKEEIEIQIPEEKSIEKEKYTAHRGSCFRVMYKKFKDNSVGYICTSTPFVDLFSYSDKDEDLGNSRDYDDFFDHIEFIAEQMYRIIKPGRLISLHCIDIPAMLERDGYIGLKDFPGELIRTLEGLGMIYHSRITIWKDPLVEAVRSHAIGLMHKQIIKNSAMCRAGLPDYIVTMRKPGINEAPIEHNEGLTEFDYFGSNPPKTMDPTKYQHQTWQKIASPIWSDIRITKTLNTAVAKENKDEKHICPLALDTVGRLILLYSNPGEIVLDPFAGIFTVPYQATAMGRHGVGIELKESYFSAGVKNMEHVVMLTNQKNLFDGT